MQAEAVNKFLQWVSLQKIRPFQVQWRSGSDCCSGFRALGISLAAFDRPWMEIDFQEPQLIPVTGFTVASVATASCKARLFDLDGSSVRLRARSVHALVRFLIERPQKFNLYDEFSHRARGHFAVPGAIESEVIGKAAHQYPRDQIQSKLLTELLGSELAELLQFAFQNEVPRFRERLHKVLEHPSPSVDLWRALKSHKRTSLLCLFAPENIPAEYQHELKRRTGTDEILRLGFFPPAQVAMFVKNALESPDSKIYYCLLLPSLIQARETLQTSPDIAQNMATVLSGVALRLSLIQSALNNGDTHCSVDEALSLGFANHPPSLSHSNSGPVRLDNLQRVLQALEYRLTHGRVSSLNTVKVLTELATEFVLPWVCAALNHEIANRWQSLLYQAKDFFAYMGSRSEIEWDGFYSHAPIQSPAHPGYAAYEISTCAGLVATGHAYSNCLANPQQRVHYLAACLAGVSRIFTIRSTKDTGHRALVTLSYVASVGWTASQTRGIHNNPVASEGNVQQLVSWLLAEHQIRHPGPYRSELEPLFGQWLVHREVSALTGKVNDMSPTAFMSQATQTFPLLEKFLATLASSDQFAILVNLELGSPIFSVLDAMLPAPVAKACRQLAGVQFPEDLTRQELSHILAVAQVAGDRPLGNKRWLGIQRMNRALANFPSQAIAHHWMASVARNAWASSAEEELELVQSFARFFRQFSVHLQMSCLTVQRWNLLPAEASFLLDFSWKLLEHLALHLSFSRTQELVNYTHSDLHWAAVVDDAAWLPIGPTQFSSQNGAISQLLSTHDLETQGISKAQARFAVMGDAAGVVLALRSSCGEPSFAVVNFDASRLAAKENSWHVDIPPASNRCAALLDAYIAHLEHISASVQKDHENRRSQITKVHSITQAKRYVVSLFGTLGPLSLSHFVPFFANYRDRFLAGDLSVQELQSEDEPLPQLSRELAELMGSSAVQTLRS